MNTHPDDVAVDRFAEAMKAKLATKRAEGYGGWDDPARCRIEFLSRKLREHVAKGDPIDVANFAMMIHERGSRILPPDPVTEGCVQSPPPIDIPEEIKPKVDAICAKYRFAPMSIADELLDTGLPDYICSNIAVFTVITQAARLAVMSAHAFEKREPRRDWWQASTTAHLDAAVQWFAETLGKEMAKENAERDFNEYRCTACGEVIEQGDLVYIENGEGGFIHAACCGPEREGYCDTDGNPLRPGDPIPAPFPFDAEVRDG